jgi:predicted small secreted protein
MKKFFSIFIPSVIIILIVAGIYIANKNKTKIYYSDSETAGNRSGNLYNAGTFCEDTDGRIYFSNPDDDFCLYSMSALLDDLKFICDDKAESINIDSHYIYYSRYNFERTDSSNNDIFEVYDSGIFRINKDDTKKLAMLYDNVCGLFSLFNNVLYYEHYDTKTACTFYCMGIDGKNDTKLSDDYVIPACIYEKKLYYSGCNGDQTLYLLDLDTLNQSVAADNSSYYMPQISGGKLFYMNPSDNYTIWSSEINGSNPVKVIDSRTCTFNLSDDGEYLYYQIDGTDNNGLHVYDNLSGNDTLIMSGDFKEINVTSRYVFFSSFDESFEYAYDSATGESNTFSPGKISH